MPVRYEEDESYSNQVVIRRSIFEGKVTVDDVVASIQETIEALNLSLLPNVVIAIMENGSNAAAALGIVWQMKLIKKFIGHDKLAEIIYLDKNTGLFGVDLSFLIETMAPFLTSTDIKGFKSQQELDFYLQTTYGQKG